MDTRMRVELAPFISTIPPYNVKYRTIVYEEGNRYENYSETVTLSIPSRQQLAGYMRDFCSFNLAPRA